ncbi:MAG TPA: PhzF family phenazine biosynthesis protein [Solirubrobacteraceae bacterium]|nr:PhzF family phenazine biosynthesis protein [Solirubrobacteraceae bacterium]
MRAYVVADVFTDTPLEGNPVAVFLDARGLSAETMQRAARELNLSETVFVVDPQRGADAAIRIFTPATELPFAGHPVLGTAFVLGESTGSDQVRLTTAAGVVPVTLTRRNGSITAGEMQQPLPSIEPFDRVPQLLAALGVSGSRLAVELYDNGPRHVYVALGDEAEVAALRPDHSALAALGPLTCSCFALCEGHVRTRVFAPGAGVAEDPATGSAAGPLAVHLARHGQGAFGRWLEIRQGQEIGRPSVIRARVDGERDRLERVLVAGSAVIVARGEYRLD